MKKTSAILGKIIQITGTGEKNDKFKYKCRIFGANRTIYDIYKEKNISMDTKKL